MAVGVPPLSEQSHTAAGTRPQVTLVVAEKPSVARDLARILGATQRAQGAYRSETLWVSWCIGHVAELNEPHAYDPAWRAWQACHLPMVPAAFTLRPASHVAAHWAQLKTLMGAREVVAVVNACDAGREGELIFRYAMELAGCRKPVRRLWLNALTDAAVRTAWRNLRPSAEYDALGDAARCRAEADWLVGLNATRALTLARRRQEPQAALFTVGRVQTPTLAMLVAREEAIEAHVPEPYWQVALRCTEAGDRVSASGQAKTDSGFKVLWAEVHKEQGREVLNHRIAERAQACAIADAARAGTAQVKALVQREELIVPPLLYDLTALQRQANVRHGLTAQATLDAAQALYEKHKAVTYPRTDSNYLPSTLAPGLPALLTRLGQGAWRREVQPLVHPAAGTKPPPLGRIVRDAEVSDHHAIIPTGKPPPPMATTPAERQVYDLITRRFIAVFYPPARQRLGRIDIEVGGALFVGRGRMLLDPGWQAIEPPLQDREGAPPLPTLARSDAVVVTDAQVQDCTTRPPPRLSEASLLGAMERAGQALETGELRLALKDAGLGTPATRAAIIETLKRRSYAEVQGRTLVPSAEGRALLAALPVEALKSAELTGLWEAKLTQVAHGTLPRTTFMAQVREMTRTIVKDILGDTHSAGALAARPAQDIGRKAAPGGRGKLAKSGQAGAKSAPAPVKRAKKSPVRPGMCPVCGGPRTETAQTLSCSRGRDCSFVIFRTVAGRPLADEEIEILLSGATTPRLEGFTSRAGRPFRAHLALDASGRVAFQFDSPKTLGSAHAEPKKA